MKKIEIYYNPRTGETVIEYSRGLNNLDIFDALARATNIVYQGVIQEEARKRDMETTDIEKFIRLVAKQKNPKLN